MSDLITTFGHGTLEQETFASILSEAGVRAVVDVRSFPGSRRNPQFGTERMQEWLPDAGLSYSWMRDLGGRRKPVPDSEHVALQHPSFRAYADHMDTPVFQSVVDDLLESGPSRAIVCSESVWWRCHRRLVADHLVLVRNVPVEHLMHDGRRMPHKPTDGVRRTGDRLVYDVGDAAVPD